jgi:hypothetical protein
VKNVRKNTIFVIVLFLGLCLSIVSVKADPVIDVTIDPVEPEPHDTVMFYATITSDEEILEVRIIMQECNDQICFSRSNESMDLVGDVYQEKFELEKSTATYIKYWLEVYTADSYTETDPTNVTLKIESGNGNGNGDENGDEDGGDDSPGFEILTLLIAVSIAFILLKRKR